MLLNLFRRRLPDRREIYAVLGVVVFVVHSWSMRGFFHEVPSFILYYKIGQILAIFLYMMAFALFESLLVTFGLGLLSLVMPVKWFRDGFIYKSFITVVVGAIAMLWLENTIMSLNNTFPPMGLLLRAAGLTFGLWVLLLLALHNAKPLQKAILLVSDRIGVLAYLYIPLGILGFVVVFVRNL